jgi:hypothetical protein
MNNEDEMPDVETPLREDANLVLILAIGLLLLAIVGMCCLS